MVMSQIRSQTQQTIACWVVVHEISFKREPQTFLYFDQSK